MHSDRDVVSQAVVAVKGSPTPSDNSVEIDRVGSNSNGVEICKYSGWVYHIGVNKFGREHLRLRFLSIRGKSVEIYTHDPFENSEIKPIQKGVIGLTFMVEAFGRQKMNSGTLYVLRFYNRLDEAKKGEFGCATVAEVKKWFEAFVLARQQVVYEFRKGAGVGSKLNMEDELIPVSPRRKLQRYGHVLRKIFGIQLDCNGASSSKNTSRHALMPPFWIERDC